MNHLLQIKKFLDIHSDVYFTIDRKNGDYVFKLKQQGSAAEVCITQNGTDVFDNLDMNIGALLDAAKIPFES